MQLIEGQFGAGGVVETPTLRSLLWPAKGADDFLFDIEAKLGGKLPKKNQGQSFSCTGQGTSIYTHVLQAIEMQKLTGLTLAQLQENQSDAVVEHSAKAVYSQVALSGGGAYASHALGIAVKWGMISERRVPCGQTEEFMRDMSWKDEIASWMASKLKNKSYAFVSPTFEAVASAIRENNGVVLVVGGVNNGTWLTSEPKPPKGSADWYHLIYCGKNVILKDRGIQTPNSWGLPFWQTLYEDYFASGHVMTALTLVDQPSTNYVRLYRKSLERLGVNLYRDLPADQPLAIKGFTDEGWNYVPLPNAVV